MKKVGLYFGSFNPIHTGHLIIAEYFATRTELDEVWLVVSPQNPFKINADLAPEEHRLQMVKLAIQGNPNLQVCEIEFEMEKPSFTVNTLRVLSKNFPKYSFTLLIGEDNIPAFHKWMEYEYILDNYAVRIFPRLHPNSRSEIKLIGKDVQMVDAPLIEISSTYIRESIRTGESIRYLTADSVSNYIKKHDLFR
jgi:nicotinate-nucleotide adenylyltransferase